MAIPAELLSRLTETANKQGRSFQTVLSQVVTGGLRVVEAGHSLEEVVDFYELMDMQKSSGAALVPADLCNYMTSKLFETDKESVIQKWRDAGSWYGRYITSKFPTRDFAEMLGKFLRATRWDLREVEAVRDGSKVRFRCIAPHLPDSSTLLLASFVEGAMASANHKLVNSEVLRGMIFQEFESLQRPSIQIIAQ